MPLSIAESSDSIPPHSSLCFLFRSQRYEGVQEKWICHTTPSSIMPFFLPLLSSDNWTKGMGRTMKRERMSTVSLPLMSKSVGTIKLLCPERERQTKIVRNREREREKRENNERKSLATCLSSVGADWYSEKSVTGSFSLLILISLCRFLGRTSNIQLGKNSHETNPMECYKWLRLEWCV